MKKFLFNAYVESFFIVLGIISFGLISKDPYVITILVFAGLNALSALGLSLLLGLAGQISLGQNGFYGLGAYLSAILSLNYKLSPLLSIFIATSLSSLFGSLLAIPAIRLKGHYLAIATLAFGEVIYLLLNELGPGGPSGFGNIPLLPLNIPFLNYSMSYLILVWSLWWISFLLMNNLSNSIYGKTLMALHSSEKALATLGINVSALKIKVFIIASFLTALSGSLYAHYITFLSPANFSIFYSILILIMVMIGGTHSLWGSFLGALFLTLLPELLRPFKDYDILIYGVILILILLFFQKGLMVPIERWLRSVSFIRG
ncbi:MAG: branched-chain amino acid ABC transporter permease [Thermodesulfobacteriaceae bacterium]|nr:branched-chain amino acid ABC transporter permease [Thermodesulfobacteriaceae bacterium]